MIGHEAEVHFHSFEPASDTANPKNVVSELKERYGEWRGDMSKLWQKNSNAFQRGFLRAQMVCCKTMRFATIYDREFN